MKNFLKTYNGKIVDAQKKPQALRGVNFGGWLMMEAYFMHAPNRPAHEFKDAFKKALGEKALRDFERQFHGNFVQESDFKKVASFGLNLIRIPFHYGLIEKRPFKYSKEGVAYLDNALNWAKKYKLKAILDLHAAPGAQNHDWHSDSDGKALLWKSKSYQHRTAALWEFLADRFKDREELAGYDLLNEAVLPDAKLLNKFYKRIIKSIRGVDRNHILFIEGNRWAQDVACLDEFDDDNYCLSIHSYEPLAFTFNFVPHLKYPLKSKTGNWDKSTTRKLLSSYVALAKKRKLPVYVGEFGVNYRGGVYNEHLWLRDTLSLFNEFGFHWTYWTYKAIKNNHFPDGLYGYYENPPWVRREGPVYGWHNFKTQWPTKRSEMIESWKTSSFKENTVVLKELKHAAS